MPIFKSSTNMRLVATVALLAVNWLVCASFSLDVFMPDVAPHTKDTYLCHQVKLDAEEPIYITEFQPKSTKEIAHHILLYGCEESSEHEVWSCGEMMTNAQTAQYPQAPVCRGKQSIVYAWAMDAPKLVLPKDVAFKLGGHTKIKNLVLQVHYANVDMFKEGHTDNSGVTLVGQKEPTSHLAGVYLMMTGGRIKARSVETFEAACEITEDVEMHPFAYRVHAHKLGVVNSGYVVKTDARGEQHWTEIGRRSPQLAQMFYPASHDVTVKKGDIMASRCTMENLKFEDVKIGMTGADEMCNVYVMYYVSGERLAKNDVCFTPGPPKWYWDDFLGSMGDRLDMSKVPADASKIPAEQAVEMSDLENPHGMHHMEAKTKTTSFKDPEPETDSAESEDDFERMRDEYLLNQFLAKYE